MAILKLTQRDDYSVEEVVTIIRSDPSLTAQLIKVANMGGSSGGAAVLTLEDAVMRIGFASLRSVALGFSLIASRPEAICLRFDYGGFWSRSLARAVAAQVLAQRSGVLNSSEAYVAGLLAGIGELALATVHPESYDELLAMREIDSALSLTSLETERYGIHHHELTAALLREWGFPGEIAQACGACAQPPRATRAVAESGELPQAGLLRAAGLLADILTREAEAAQEDVRELEQLVGGLGLSPEQTAEHFETIKQAWVEWGKVLNIATARVRTLVEIARTTRGDTGEVALKVLLANVPESARDPLAAALTAAGCQVLTAESNAAALEVFIGELPQVVVAGDFQGGPPAIALLQPLRQAEVGHFGFRIVLTDARDDTAIVALLTAGFDDYVVAPPAPELLVAKVRSGRRVIDLQRTVAEDQKKMRRQVADLAVLNRKLHHASLTDPLTQLPNRRSAMEHLDRCWSTVHGKLGTFTVVMADIDHFKKVNDEHGHQVGDEVLSRVGQVLRQTVRTEDHIFRLGGEEFLFLCPDTDLKSGIIAAERVRRAVEATIIQKDSFNRHVTISLGVAAYEPSLSRVEELVNRADEAAYRAKTGGRNRVSCHGRPA